MPITRCPGYRSTRRLVGRQASELVRGDAEMAGEPMLKALEERGQIYLFKLRLTTNLKRYIEKLFWEENWRAAGQGWEGRHRELELSGWSRLRRVVVASGVTGRGATSR